jgi:hypothetical protein
VRNQKNDWDSLGDNSETLVGDSGVESNTTNVEKSGLGIAEKFGFFFGSGVTGKVDLKNWILSEAAKCFVCVY